MSSGRKTPSPHSLYVYMTHLEHQALCLIPFACQQALSYCGTRGQQHCMLCMCREHRSSNDINLLGEQRLLTCMRSAIQQGLQVLLIMSTLQVPPPIDYNRLVGSSNPSICGCSCWLYNNMQTGLGAEGLPHTSSCFHHLTITD